jgi:hypothetical protein
VKGGMNTSGLRRKWSGRTVHSAQAFHRRSVRIIICVALFPYRIHLCRIVPLIHFDEDGEPEAVLLC